MKTNASCLLRMICITLFLFPIHSHAAQKPTISVSIASNSLTVSADSAPSLYVRIGGPEDYFAEVCGTDYVQWYPDLEAGDGVYRFDVYAATTDALDALRETEKEMQGKRFTPPQARHLYTAKWGID